MKTTLHLLALGGLSLLASPVAAYIKDPPTTAADDTVSDCSQWTVSATGDDCEAISIVWQLSLEDFGTVYNPSVGMDCNLTVGQSYCVERGDSGDPPATTTTAGNGVATPTPTQDGLTSSCDEFYLVKQGDQCGTIASENDISLGDFYKWNSGVGDACDTLWAGTYACVHVLA